LIIFAGKDRNIPIPFGPYIAAAGWLAMIWGERIIGTYLEFSGLS
ncbi:MAG: prepilin peptidase, partial [Pseudomonadota bacterium]